MGFVELLSRRVPSHCSLQMYLPDISFAHLLHCWPRSVTFLYPAHDLGEATRERHAQDIPLCPRTRAQPRPAHGVSRLKPNLLFDLRLSPANFSASVETLEIVDHVA